MDNAGEGMAWFAMSAPFCKELDAKRFLDKRQIESYIPMCYKVLVKNNKKIRELVPAIHNLVFVKTTRNIIQETKRCVSFLQYITKTEAGRRIPIIVPDWQMQQFIAISQTYDEHLVYLTPDEINLKKGTPIRILGGPFDGVEGFFVKIKGCRSKRVVVFIQGIIAVAMTEVQPDLIEIISPDKMIKL